MTNSWQQRKRLILRVLSTASTFLCALLVYPWIVVPVGALAAVLYGAYEVVLAGLVLDALLAPGAGIFGEYRFTVIMFIVVFGAYVTRMLFRGTRAV